jgi:hypothetical protein
MSELPTTKIDPALIRRTNKLLPDAIRAVEPQRQDSTNSTRLVHQFGYNALKLLHGDRTRTPIPGFLQHLCGVAIGQFNGKGGKQLPPVENFTNCLISDYRRGQKLGAHIDEHATQKRSHGKTPEFFFGDDIVGVILKADASGRLYFIESDKPHPAYKPDKAVHVPEEDGVAFLMTGDLRREPFSHGVTKVEDRRVSVTYRTVHFR